MKLYRATLALCLSGISACGVSQDATTVKGDCNSVIKGNGNTVTVSCAGRKQALELQQLLGKLLASQVAPDVLIKHLDDLEKGVAKCGERRLTGEEVERFKRALGPRAPTTFVMTCETRASDSCTYAQDFADAMASAGWKAGVGDVITAVGGDVPVGIAVVVSKQDQLEGKVDAANRFVGAAQQIGVGVQRFNDLDVPQGIVEVRFGRRP